MPVFCLDSVVMGGYIKQVFYDGARHTNCVMSIPSLGKNLMNKPRRMAIQRLIDAAGSAVLRPLRRPFPDIKSLLVVRTGATADVFLSTAILPHLRSAFPKADIRFMTGANAEACLKSNPYIDGVILCGRPATKGLAGVFGLFVSAGASFFKAIHRMRRAPFDLVIDLSTRPGYSIPALYSGRPRYMIGFSTAGCGFLLDKAVENRLGSHESERLSDMLGALGIGASRRIVKPEFTLSRAVELECRELLEDLGLSDREPFVLLHTGSGASNALWRKERWQEVVDKTRREYGLRAVVYDTVYGDIRGCIKLPALVSFEVLAAATKMAELFIGIEPLHAYLAASFGTPSVLIRSGINDGACIRPPGSSLSIVRKNLPCAPCLRKRGCPGMSCMEITSEECMMEVRGPLDSLISSKVVRLRR